MKSSRLRYCQLDFHPLTRETSYSLVYDMEVILPIGMKIASLQILMETELEKAD